MRDASRDERTSPGAGSRARHVDTPGRLSRVTSLARTARRAASRSDGCPPTDACIRASEPAGSCSRAATASIARSRSALARRCLLQCESARSEGGRTRWPATILPRAPRPRAAGWRQRETSERYVVVREPGSIARTEDRKHHPSHPLRAGLGCTRNAGSTMKPMPASAGGNSTNTGRLSAVTPSRNPADGERPSGGSAIRAQHGPHRQREECGRPDFGHDQRPEIRDRREECGRLPLPRSPGVRSSRGQWRAQSRTQQADQDKQGRLRQRHGQLADPEHRYRAARKAG